MFIKSIDYVAKYCQPVTARTPFKIKITMCTLRVQIRNFLSAFFNKGGYGYILAIDDHTITLYVTKAAVLLRHKRSVHRIVSEI